MVGRIFALLWKGAQKFTGNIEVSVSCLCDRGDVLDFYEACLHQTLFPGQFRECPPSLTNARVYAVTEIDVI